MGRHRWSGRYRVEDCRVLNIARLTTDGFFEAVSGGRNVGSYGSGHIAWNNQDGEVIASIGVSTRLTVERGEFRVNYHWQREETGEGDDLEYPITLVPTPCRFGGRRWWFLCPATANGIYCGRRVGCLYLPPNAIYFACRHCYNLTYQSCREISKAKLVQRVVRLI